VVDVEAGEIGREEGRWICELSPAPLPPPGAVHSCDDLFVEAAQNTEEIGEIRNESQNTRNKGEKEKAGKGVKIPFLWCVPT